MTEQVESYLECLGATRTILHWRCVSIGLWTRFSSGYTISYCHWDGIRFVGYPNLTWAVKLQIKTRTARARTQWRICVPLAP
jgi:hypothetical protein